MKLNHDQYCLKLATTEVEILAAQRLRYRVFVEEMGAKASTIAHKEKREFDRFDPFFDHLILIDEAEENIQENVIAVYRLLRSDKAVEVGGFYGAGEYDLSLLEKSSRKSVELGRSCVAKAHRGGPAMHLMWNGLAGYVADHGIEILFGVASFHGQDPAKFAHALSYLHHGFLAPEDLRVAAHRDRGASMDLIPADQVDRLAAMRQMPPLIKAYLRLGGMVGQGAYIDYGFNTIDVCLLMDTKRMSQKHRKIYEQSR